MVIEKWCTWRWLEGNCRMLICYMYVEFSRENYRYQLKRANSETITVFPTGEENYSCYNIYIL